LNLDRVDFIKCDIEGYEIQMLHGAAATIEKYRPAIYVEFLAQYGPGDISQEVGRILGAIGYDVHYYLTPIFSEYNFKGVKENCFPGGASWDLLCTPRERFTVEGLMAVEGRPWQDAAQAGWLVPRISRHAALAAI
jgi:hypothetical protein